MKRIFLFAALLTAAVAETFACTNLIVGKNAVQPSFPIRPTRTDFLASCITIRQPHIPKAP